MTQRSYDVIAFCAHPDDAEFSMGGTLCRIVEDGLSLLIVSFTEGDMGTYGTVITRRQESAAAAKKIGADSLLLNFPDTQLENDVTTRNRCVEILRTYTPRIVFAPYHTNPLAELGGVSHRDHPVAGAIVRDAIKLARLEKVLPHLAKHTVKRSYFYMLPRTIQPTMIVDVTKVLPKAFEAIRCYATQMSIARGSRTIEEILSNNRAALGYAYGIDYAEGFVTDIPLHMTPEAFVKL